MFTFHLCPCSVLYLNAHLSSHVLQVPIPNYESTGNPKGLHSAFLCSRLRGISLLCIPWAFSLYLVSNPSYPTLNYGHHSVHLVSHEVKVLEDNSWPLSTFASLSTQKRIDAQLMSDVLNWRELNWNTWGLFYNSVNSSVPATIICWKLGGFCALTDMNWKTIWEVNLRLRKDSAPDVLWFHHFHSYSPFSLPSNSCQYWTVALASWRIFIVSLLFYLLSIPHPLKGSLRRQLWNNYDDDDNNNNGLCFHGIIFKPGTVLSA